MQRGNGGATSPTGIGGGLGSQLVGERILVNDRTLTVAKLLGEGAFSFVYLVRDEIDKKDRSHSPTPDHTNCNVLKITSIHSREHREIAEKEADLLRRLNHPSIVRMLDFSYRNAPSNTLGSGSGGILSSVVGHHHQINDKNTRAQHLILMEYCEDGHALDVMRGMKANGERFSLSSLIIAFGQICNAVSYIHAQKPPIVHRDLKPNNFLVNRGSYKLCDFGSAIFGDVELKSQLDRINAEEVIQKTTTQMFRAPEMVDLYMTDKLTQSTDVWALGCCLYSMAYFQNCFEEGSNLAIISNNYKIPDYNPYGDELVDLIDRMLTRDYKDRADMTEVIMCLSALYAGKKIPSRRKGKKGRGRKSKSTSTNERIGSYRTNGQGINHPVDQPPNKAIEAKKLDPNSAAARRKAHRTADPTTSSSQPEEEKTSLTSSFFNKKKATDTFDAAFENFPTSFKGDFFSNANIQPSTVDNKGSTRQQPISVQPKVHNKDSSDDFTFGNFDSICFSSKNDESSHSSLKWKPKKSTAFFPPETVDFFANDDISFPAFEEEGCTISQSAADGYSRLSGNKMAIENKNHPPVRTNRKSGNMRDHIERARDIR